MKRNRSVLIALSAVLVLADVRAQSPEKPLTFEVASIKPNASGKLVAGQTLAKGRYAATNLSIFDLFAATYYPMARSRIIGAPTWMISERFDIVAKADGSASEQDRFAMVRSLLVERCKLVVHPERREADVYALVLSRQDGKLGPALRRSTANCRPWDGSSPPSGQAATIQCPGRTLPGRVTATAIPIPIPMFGRMLMQWLDQREVRDHTGLTGVFDIDLTFTPDQPFRLPPNAPDDLTRAVHSIDPNGPSLASALQEQLGLRLEIRKETVDVIVIDHVEKPTSD